MFTSVGVCGIIVPSHCNTERQGCGMTNCERLMKTIRREQTDYMPSEITFADRTRNRQLARQLGLRDEQELAEYIDNHFEFLYTKHDQPLFFRNDLAWMRKRAEEGVVGLDEERRMVYDLWGVGIEITDMGFNPIYAPLGGDKRANDLARPFLPRSFNSDLLDMPVERAVEAYQAPDPFCLDNFQAIVEQDNAFSRDVLHIPSGYFGVFERSHGIVGLTNLMLYAAAEPEMLEIVLDKVVDYKLKVAHKYVEMGFKVCHHGDDFGIQTGTMFSPDMIRRMFLPRLRKIFKVYKDAGIKVMYHSCGNITAILPDLIEAGVDILEPVQPCMDFEFLKREYGKYLVFMGGIDTQFVLPYASPDEVRAHVRQVVRTLGRDGGYIIAPSQEIMNDVPIENIVAMIQTIREERANFG